MNEIAVVTDSCASIPEALIEELNIHVVAYYIHRGEEVLRDLVTITRQPFLDWLSTAKILPTTASPGPGDYLELYEKLAQKGVREIISLHMTSKGSGAFQAARIAQSIANDAIPDTRIASYSKEEGYLAASYGENIYDFKDMGEGVVRPFLPVVDPNRMTNLYLFFNWAVRLLYPSAKGC